MDKPNNWRRRWRRLLQDFSLLSLVAAAYLAGRLHESSSLEEQENHLAAEVRRGHSILTHELQDKWGKYYTELMKQARKDYRRQIGEVDVEKRNPR